MQKYITFYKTSHKLIIAPWIKYSDCSDDLSSLENKMTLDDILYCREIAFTELITEGRAFCASGEIGEGYKPLIHLWEFYVNDLRSKWMNKSDTNAQIQLSDYERRDLMMLANLDKDKVILSYLKGEPNHPDDKLSVIQITLNLIIINISRKVRPEDKKDKRDRADRADRGEGQINEVKTQLNFYTSLYNDDLTARLNKSKFFNYLNKLSQEELTEIIAQEKKVDGNKTLSDSASDDEREVHFNDEEQIPNQYRNSIHNKTTSVQNERLDNYKSKATGRPSYSKAKTEVFHFEKESELGELVKRNLERDKEMNSVDYLDEIVVENLNDYLPSEANERLFTNQLSNRSSALRKIEVDKININQLHNFIPEDQLFNIQDKAGGESKRHIFNKKKTILSILFGGLNIKTKSRRNGAQKLNVNIHTFNLIDHNLTYTLANKKTEDTNKILTRTLTDSNTNPSYDHINSLFKQMFEENNHHSFHYINENRLVASEKADVYFTAAMAKFLFDILTIDKYREFILINGLEHEKNFIHNFRYKFGFHAIDPKSEQAGIEENFKLVTHFLFDKEIIKDRFTLIEDIIKKLRKGHILTDKKGFLNRKFIHKVFDIGMQDNQKGTNLESEVGLNKIKFAFPRWPVDNNANLNKVDRIRKEMIEDLNYVMQSICISLMKYVFSSIYPYFLNDEGFKMIFRNSMKAYVEKISEVNKDKQLKRSFFMGIVERKESHLFNLTMRKQGREYPYYIYKETERKEKVEKNNKNDKKDKPSKEENNEKGDNNDKNDRPITKSEVRSPNTKHIHNENIIITENPTIVEMTKTPTNSNSLDVKISKSINLNVTNETIGELICCLSSLKSADSEGISFAGNIITDLKKSYLEIYDSLTELIAKWNVMKYLKTLQDKKGIMDENDSFEMNYLKSKANFIENLIKNRTSISVNIKNINFKIIDKLFFVSSEKESSMTVKICHVEFKTNKMNNLPINYSEEIQLANTVKNKKKFNFEEIIKVYTENEIGISKIIVLIDEENVLLETDLKVKQISSLIKNIPFLPNQIIDITSSYIKVYLTPKIAKVSDLFSNLSYYQKTYKEDFEICVKKHSPNNKPEKSKNENTSLSITAHFHQRFQNILLKLLSKSSESQNNSSFVSYLANRNDTSLFYSIGRFNSSMSNDEFYVDDKFGLFIELMVRDKKISPAKQNDLENNSGEERYKFSPDDSMTEANDSILTLHIPILIYNQRDTLFYQEKQLWLRDVFTSKYDADKNLDFARMSIKFDNKDQFDFKSFEFLFCRHFVDTIDYFNQNDHNIKSVEDVQFDSPKFPFDFKFKTPSKLKLNNFFHQKSFYYETHENLRNKVYTKLFSDSRNLGIKNGRIFSSLELSIDKVSCNIVIMNNSQIRNFADNFKNMLKARSTMDSKKFNIPAKKIQDDKLKVKISHLGHMGTSIVIPSIEKKWTRKISAHTIQINVNKLKFKIFAENKNNHNNLMLFYVINDLAYEENMNLKEIQGRSQNNYESNNSKELQSPSIFTISDIKLVMSIPTLIRKPSVKKIQVLNEEKMQMVFDKLKEEENKLIVVLIGKISTKLVQDPRSQIIFQVSDVVKLGFVKRTGLKVKTDIDPSDIEPLIWIPSSEVNFQKQEADLSSVDNTLRSNFIKIDNINRRRTEQLEWVKEKLIENEIYPQSNYSLKLTVLPIQVKSRQSEGENNDTLFFNLSKIMTILQSLTKLKTEYMLKIDFNMVIVDIPWFLFHYVYFMRNHYKNIASLFKEKKEGPIKEDIEYNSDPESKVRNIKKLDNIIAAENPTLNINKNRIFKKNTMGTRKSTLDISQSLNFLKKTTFQTVEETRKKPIVKRQTLKPTLPRRSTLESGAVPYLNSENYYDVSEINVPFLNFSFRHKNTESKIIEFANFTLSNVKGQVKLNLDDRTKDTLNLTVDNFKWKPYESKYKNLLVKHSNSKSPIIELEIKLRKKKLNDEEAIMDMMHMQTREEDEVDIIAHIREATFIMVNKGIKDLILFFEKNSECLKKNVPRKILAELDKVKPGENATVLLKFSGSTVLVPESSQSANLIIVDFTKGRVVIKKTNEVPKICVESQEPLLIIDKKSCFNATPKEADHTELCPHMRIEITGKDVTTNFLINNKISSFMKAEKLNLSILQPQNDTFVMLLRKKLWEDKFKAHVVTYKPSLNGKMFSIKLFVDGNIDEKSNVIEDTNSKFDNIDLNFDIEAGEGRIDVFKMHDKFTEKVEYITKNLPGYENELNIDPFNKNTI